MHHFIVSSSHRRIVSSSHLLIIPRHIVASAHHHTLRHNVSSHHIASCVVVSMPHRHVVTTRRLVAWSSHRHVATSPHIHTATVYGLIITTSSHRPIVSSWNLAVSCCLIVKGSRGVGERPFVVVGFRSPSVLVRRGRHLTGALQMPTPPLHRCSTALSSTCSGTSERHPPRRMLPPRPLSLLCLCLCLWLSVCSCALVPLCPCVLVFVWPCAHMTMCPCALVFACPCVLDVLVFLCPYGYMPLLHGRRFRHSTPLHFTPLHSTPLHSTPLHYSTPLHSIPLQSIPLHSTPFHGRLFFFPFLVRKPFSSIKAVLSTANESAFFWYNAVSCLV